MHLPLEICTKRRSPVLVQVDNKLYTDETMNIVNKIGRTADTGYSIIGNGEPLVCKTSIDVWIIALFGKHRPFNDAIKNGEVNPGDAAHLLWCSDGMTPMDCLSRKDVVDACKHIASKPSENIGYTWSGPIANNFHRFIQNMLGAARNTARINERVSKYASRGYNIVWVQCEVLSDEQWGAWVIKVVLTVL
jgi:hypothetical protein